MERWRYTKVRKEGVFKVENGALSLDILVFKCCMLLFCKERLKIRQTSSKIFKICHPSISHLNTLVKLKGIFLWRTSFVRDKFCGETGNGK